MLINPIDIERWVDLNILDIIPDKYEISTFGNIRFKDTKQIKSQYQINSGYMTIRLATYSGTKNFLVHRLVAIVFIPNDDINKNQVNHIECNKTDNYYKLLEWCDGKENMAHALQHNRVNVGEKNYLSKLTDNQVYQICELLQQGKSYKEILDIIGMDSSPYSNNYDLIGNIKRGIAWKHISRNYDFSNISYTNSNFTTDQIHDICRSLENGETYKDIYLRLFGIELKSSRENKNFYEFIRRIKNKKIFVDISNQYNL